MKFFRKLNKTQLIIPEIIFFFLVLVFLASIYFSEQRQHKNQLLVSRIDHLIISLQNTSSIEKATQEEKNIYHLAKEIDYKKGLIRSRIILLTKLYDQQKYELTLKLIDKSIKESNKINNSFYFLKLLQLKSSCYSAVGLYDDSRALLNQIKDIAMKLPNNNEHYYTLGMAYKQLAMNFDESKHVSDSALFYFKVSYKYLKKVSPDSDFNSTRIDILTRIGHLYAHKKQYDSAKKYLSCIYTINEKDKQKNKILMLNSYVAAAELHLIKREYHQAVTDYQNILNISDSIRLSHYKQKAYYKLSEAHGKLLDKKKENYYLKKYTEISDSLHSNETKIMRVPLENIIIEKESLEEKTTESYMWVTVFLISLISFGYLRLNKIKRDSLANLNFSENISYPRTVLKKSQSKYESDQDLKLVIELAKQNDPTLYAEFKAFDPDFTQNLLRLAPDLLASELEMCIFLRLNFETKEISRYTDFSVRAIQGKKHRIRKKLKISSKEDLSKWLNNL